ncbi:MAG: PEP-CTERM sorting domain-containing protein [Burkholderiaceae bacterium]|jgi:hypothetical protein|nr:PEP-CTERM sorting domain-containing protein [Burkholderiaceae bacterium]
MKGSIAVGALVAGALAVAVPVTAATYDTFRVSGSPASLRSAPAEQEVGQVPVPGTVALLALGGVGLTIVRRVKSRRRGK